MDRSAHLPDLSSDYKLSQDQISAYQRDGHIQLRGVASAGEISVYRNVIGASVQKLNHETRPIAERDTYGKAFLQIHNLWVKDELVKRYTLARRFAKIAAELMGVKAVRIYHDQALFKEPGGGPTPWHQDRFYWPLDTDKTVTMWMPLVPADFSMGTMTFASGSHHHRCLSDRPISDESEAEIATLLKEHKFPVKSYGEFAAGDASFHSGWTLHRAEANTTGTMREVMTVIYMDAEARVVEPNSESQQKDLEWWLPGLRAGDLAASELNPVVFPVD